MKYTQYVILSNGEFKEEYKLPENATKKEIKALKKLLMSHSVDTMDSELLDHETSIDDVVDEINDMKLGLSVITFNSNIVNVTSAERMMVGLGIMGKDDNFNVKISSIIESNISDLISENYSGATTMLLEEIIFELNETLNSESIPYDKNELCELEIKVNGVLAFGKEKYKAKDELKHLKSLKDIIKRYIDEVKEYNNESLNESLEEFLDYTKDYIKKYKDLFNL